MGGAAALCPQGEGEIVFDKEPFVRMGLLVMP